MDNEKAEGTETLEKETGSQPLDLGQLIKVAVDGKESDSASERFSLLYSPPPR